MVAFRLPQALHRGLLRCGQGSASGAGRPDNGPTLPAHGQLFVDDHIRGRDAARPHSERLGQGQRAPPLRERARWYAALHIPASVAPSLAHEGVDSVDREDEPLLPAVVCGDQAATN